jgi:hypothetical protein
MFEMMTAVFALHQRSLGSSPAEATWHGAEQSNRRNTPNAAHIAGDDNHFAANLLL